MVGLPRLLTEARSQAWLALDGESIVQEGPANMLQPWEGVGGWLVLSPEWLVFMSHNFNWHTGQLLLPVARIRKVAACWGKLFGVIPVAPTTLAVRMAGGREYVFVVGDRHRWVSLIQCLLTEPDATADRPRE
jgi:hypothetical protein